MKTKMYKLRAALIITLANLLICSSVFAQSPQKMSYQAVIRNSSSQLITSHAVGMQISILQGSPVGTLVYSEIQTPTTNVNGLVTIEIGGGTGFDTIHWATGPYFIKTETDPSGGTAYSITGTSELLSTPYALYAKTAENLSGGITETDPVFVAWDKSTGINITASQVSDFETSVTNNAAVLLNTAKNSYPTADATKLAGIAVGAEVNVNADWNAVSGDAQILNKPTIPTNTNQLTNGAGFLSSFTETDPIFAAWNKSTGISITKSQISDLPTYLTSYTETDPVFGAWDKTTGINITASQVSDFETSVTNNVAVLLNTAKNSYPTADATKLAGIAAGAEVNVQADWNQATSTADDFIKNKPVGTNIGDMQYWNDSAWVKVPVGLSGQHLILIGSVPQWEGATFTITIGQACFGGIVAYIFQPGDPGYIAGQTHGLIAAPSDQSTGAQWGCYGTNITGAAGTAIGTGNQNTIDIMAGCATAGIAARLCGDLVLGGYSDWYLPSKDELNKLYLNRVAVGGFASNFYWSSSELAGYETNYAWYQGFSSGGQYDYGKNYPNYVRAVRAF